VARNGRATVFPQAIALGATFDEDLLFRVADAISDEARAKFNAAISIENRGQYAGLTFWSPNVNIFRDPRWGRGQETYGEDPFLSGKLGAAFVRGIQGNDTSYLKAAACAKHYVVHSGPEGLRHEFDAVPPIKDFYETYLPAFEELVVNSKVEGVMGAYNRTFGEPCCGSPFLLKDILREKWGFTGYIVSDCGAIYDFHQYHKVTNNEVESAALAVNSGVNLNCGNVYSSLKDAVDQGLVSEATIDESLSTLLRTKFKLGLFDPPERNQYNSISTRVINSSKHRRLAREAAQKCIVLLKNDFNTLPIKKDLKFVYVVGPHATNADILLGNYYGVSSNLNSVLEGITAKVSPGTTVQYNHGQLFDRENLNPIDWSTGAAANADVVIAVMGINGLLEGEEGESIASPHKGDRFDIKLPPNQINYLKKLRSKSDKPIVLIVTGGSPIDLTDIEDYVDAILFVWYPGEEGGNAVADIIFGDVSPSGRLPITFPKSLDDLPPYDDYSMIGRTYKYMEKEPLYPFGYGLSYTNFLYEGITLSKNKISKSDSLLVLATIKNTGEVTGSEVVQIYLTDMEASARTPLYSLKGIKRVEIRPGEKKEVSFKIRIEDLTLINEEGEKVIEEGQFKITIGGSSPGKTSLKLGAPEPVEAFFELR
jgi:beta-glucosidase